LAGKLGRHGVRVRTAVVYRAAAAERLPPETQQAIAAGELDGVVHYSRRSAEIFFPCGDGPRRRERAPAPAHFSFSPQAPAPLTEAGATDVRIAARPEELALLDLVGSA